MLCRLRVLVVAHFLCRGREFNSQNLSGTLDDCMHLNLCTGRRTRQSVSALLTIKTMMLVNRNLDRLSLSFVFWLFAGQCSQQGNRGLADGDMGVSYNDAAFTTQKAPSCSGASDLTRPGPPSDFITTIHIANISYTT